MEDWFACYSKYSLLKDFVTERLADSNFDKDFCNEVLEILDNLNLKFWDIFNGVINEHDVEKFSKNPFIVYYISSSIRLIRENENHVN